VFGIGNQMMAGGEIAAASQRPPDA
jgi:hypothetical protein